MQIESTFDLVDSVVRMVEVAIAVGSLFALALKSARKFLTTKLQGLADAHEKLLVAMEQQRKDLKEAATKLGAHDKDIEGLTKNVRRLEDAVQILSGEVSKLQGQLELIVKTMLGKKDEDS